MDKEEEYISYRVTTANRYVVFKSSYGGKDFYKIQLEKKNKDKTSLKFYRNLKFVNCEPPHDRDIIRIRRAFEDNYIDPKNKYNDVCVIVVMDYEKFEDEEKLKEQAFEDFHRTMDENEIMDTSSLPF